MTGKESLLTRMKADAARLAYEDDLSMEDTFFECDMAHSWGQISAFLKPALVATGPKCCPQRGLQLAECARRLQQCVTTARWTLEDQTAINYLLAGVVFLWLATPQLSLTQADVLLLSQVIHRILQEEQVMMHRMIYVKNQLAKALVQSMQQLIASSYGKDVCSYRDIDIMPRCRGMNLSH